MKFILRLDDGTVIQSSPSLVKKYSPQEAYHAGLVDDLHLHRMEYIHTRIENNLDGFLAAHDQEVVVADVNKEESMEIPEEFYAEEVYTVANLVEVETFEDAPSQASIKTKRRAKDRVKSGVVNGIAKKINQKRRSAKMVANREPAPAQKPKAA